MDPMTQSAQISSSQGLADGQHLAAKESKLSDSFLSSSPVSLIQSPQDKRVILGSEKPRDGVATSLHFPSQSGSFTTGNYGSDAGPPDGQPNSPIKTSPVSERIKALEALAAKKKEPDFRSDGGFSHFRDRQNEKSQIEPLKSPIGTPKDPIDIPKFLTKKIPPHSADKESPESPFEVLGELRQVNEFEETEEWMKAHLPPVPDYDAVDVLTGTFTSDNVGSKREKGLVLPDAPAAFAGVPTAFMDFSAEALKLKEEFSVAQKHSSVEEESDFDLSFLPISCMSDQQDKTGALIASNLVSVISDASAPPSGFDSPSPSVGPSVGTDDKPNVSDDKTTWTVDLEPPEASEADSSGESDDTVIEDGATVPPSSDPAVSTEPIPATANLITEENKPPPPKSERKLMQVPTINVIETDEPNYSDEEMEMEIEEDDDDYEKALVRVSPKTLEQDDTKNELPKVRPLETEFMEGYSPPSSPVHSDPEYSPKHNILQSLPEIVHQESTLALEAQFEKPCTTFSRVTDEPSPFIVLNEDVKFPDKDEDWSDEAQDILVKPCVTPYSQPKMGEKSNTSAKDAYMETTHQSKTSFMQDDIYDRQSFDYECDASSILDDIDDMGLNNARQRFLSDPSQILIEPLNACSQNLEDFPAVSGEEALPKPIGQPSLTEYPQDPYSSFQSEKQSSINDQDLIKEMTTNVTENMTNCCSLPAQNATSKIQQDTKAGHHALDSTSNTESIVPASSTSEPTDSFVEFMRECLKSRQDEEPDDTVEVAFSDEKVCKIVMPFSQSPPTMVMDLEQERLTLDALKELGSSYEEEYVEPLQSRVRDQNTCSPSPTSTQQSSFAAAPNSPCSQGIRVLDNTYSKEVEAIDEWVAEAYHLAEHVLTAILTHLSVKDLIHWRDPKKSGLVFGLSMLLLLSLAAFSFISVVSYLLLALLCVTITFRIYKSVVQAVQKSSDGHPFKTLIEKDVSIPPETFRKHVDSSLTHINRALKQMSRLFLVEDLVDSLKLAVVMWLFTYVGAVFNGITILILADILLFAVPPVYEKNKTQIDQYIDVIRTQVNTTMAKLQEKLPGAVKRCKTE
ncbi:reticulon-3 isoform 2-T2 [Spinachia spinachia]